jgi:hypothetical protein
MGTLTTEERIELARTEVQKHMVKLLAQLGAEGEYTDLCRGLYGKLQTMDRDVLSDKEILTELGEFLMDEVMSEHAHAIQAEIEMLLDDLGVAASDERRSALKDTMTHTIVYRSPVLHQQIMRCIQKVQRDIDEQQRQRREQARLVASRRARA